MGLSPCVLTTGLLMLASVEYWTLIGPPRGELDLLEYIMRRDDVTRESTLWEQYWQSTHRKERHQESFYKKVKKSKKNLQKYWWALHHRSTASTLSILTLIFYLREFFFKYWDRKLSKKRKETKNFFSERNCKPAPCRCNLSMIRRVMYSPISSCHLAPLS